MNLSEIRCEARECLKGKWGSAAIITLVYFLITYAIYFITSFIPIIGPILQLVISVPISFGIISSFMSLKRGEDVTCVDFLSRGFNNFGKAWSVTLHTILKLLPWIIAIVLIIVSIGVLVYLQAQSTIATTFNYNSAFSDDSNTIINSIEEYSDNYNTDFPDDSNPALLYPIIRTILFLALFIIYIVVIIKSLYYSLSMYILNDNTHLSGKEIVEKSKTIMTGNRLNLVLLGLTFIGWSILAWFTLGIGLLWLLPYICVSQVIFYEDKSNS